MPAGDGSSRSRSRERGQGSRSGSYDSYDSYSDNYSDEFYSDEESGRGREDKKSANSKTFLTEKTSSFRGSEHEHFPASNSLFLNNVRDVKGLKYRDSTWQIYTQFPKLPTKLEQLNY